MFIPVVAAAYEPAKTYGQAVPKNWYRAPNYKKINKSASNKSEEERA
jgi:hypothetical protein